MAEFPLSKPVITGSKRDASTLGNAAYAVFVLFCFWAGSQAINLLMNMPGLFEHLMQSSGAATRPYVEMGFGVNILFGLGVFTVGALVLGAIVFAARLFYPQRA
ncbi:MULTISPECIES: DUF2755 family protein [Tenebrionibacter/Tenebrionicola group]|jgi:hypothetical protein|uniref:DUF2755 family protein n=2 Tax=Tenebrionibacter/Tenebrionicola group TaxID=2969848 RepID=A0A8K0XXX0_9ENTR|nr:MULTISPECIES: DUF2755 family protein [Tenebrionibacter/Tenebrionicola group]MBK4715802.1 DUF2755 family protein [Tenebrionibacter intestinalis]MBV5096500.1 DUF2755 family protein [Tenebrionicola larvae]